MRFFYFKNEMYDLSGWSNYIDITGMYLLDKFCELEQMFHYNSKRKTDWDSKAFWFYISDKELMDFSKVKSRNTLKKYIETLIKFNLIETREERSKNYKGKATEYRIIKPLPLPPKVEFPRIFIERHGRNYLEKMIEEHKSLLSINSAQILSAQDLTSISEENETKGFKICAPSIELELEREKERRDFENLSDKPELSFTQEKIISHCGKYISQAGAIVSRYFEKISPQKEELILSVLEKNTTNGFEPGNPYQFVLSLFTNDNELEKLGAATLNKTGGFSKKTHSFPIYADKKAASARRAASKTTERHYYDEIIEKAIENDQVDLQDFQEITDSDLPY